jgi:hypothetical protein
MNGPVAIRRLPRTAEAIRFNGDNAALIADWAGPDATYEGGRLVIHTPQGDMTPSLGDWVISGLAGEFYPITTKAFTAGWEVIG